MIRAFNWAWKISNIIIFEMESSICKSIQFSQILNTVDAIDLYLCATIHSILLSISSPSSLPKYIKLYEFWNRPKFRAHIKFHLLTLMYVNVHLWMDSIFGPIIFAENKWTPNYNTFTFVFVFGKMVPMIAVWVIQCQTNYMTKQ